AMGLMTAIAYVKRPSALSGAASAPVLSPDPEPATSSPTVPAAAITPPSKNQPAAVFTWRQIESEEYKSYIANLRSVGCPEQTIRDIIIADVNKLYAAREAPLKPKSTGARKANQAQISFAPDELEKRKQLREIQIEKRAVLKELLGI